MTSYGSNFRASDVEATSVKTSKLTLGLGTAPVSATAPGNVGEFRIASDYIYVCVALNEWVRGALVTWGAAA